MISQRFWWIWAVSSAVLASALSQPAVLLLFNIAVIAIANNYAASSASLRYFKIMLRAAFFIAIFRFGVQILLGSPMGTQTVLTLPQIELPIWLSGLRLGGEVTALSIEYGAMQALRLASLVVIFAGVAAISNPRDLLESNAESFKTLRLFGSLTLNFLPQLSRDAERLLKANRWRGQKSNRITQISRNLIPLTETVLERAVNQGAALSIRTKQQQVVIPPNSNRRLKIWLATSVVLGMALVAIADPILTFVTAIVFVVLSLELFDGWQKILAIVQNRNFWYDTFPIFALLLFLVSNHQFDYVSFAQPAFDSRAFVGQLVIATLLVIMPTLKGARHVKN